MNNHPTMSFVCGKNRRAFCDGAAIERAVVVTVTIAVDSVVPFSTTEAGALHEAAIGAPSQSKVTVPLNPLMDVNVKL